MWVEDDDFILASNIQITAPTGDELRDLGAGEATISPLVTTWHDLGNWNSLLLNFGPQFGVSSGDRSMTYGFSLAHSWIGRSILDDEAQDDHDHGAHDGHAAHFAPGMTTLVRGIYRRNRAGRHPTHVRRTAAWHQLRPSRKRRTAFWSATSHLKNEAVLSIVLRVVHLEFLVPAYD